MKGTLRAMNFGKHRLQRIFSFPPARANDHFYLTKNVNDDTISLFGEFIVASPTLASTIVFLLSSIASPSKVQLIPIAR
jgi:hypothetical protein